MRKLAAPASGLALLAALSGCDSSKDVHVADPAGAAKSLIDEKVQPRKVKNPRLQRLIDEEQREIQKHPKIR